DRARRPAPHRRRKSGGRRGRHGRRARADQSFAARRAADGMNRVNTGLFLAFLLLAGWLPQALAQDYPNRPVQIIVGYSPGGGSDVLARVIAPPLSKILA